MPETENIGVGIVQGKYNIAEFNIKDSFSPDFDKIMIAKLVDGTVVHTTGKVLIKQFSTLVNINELPQVFTVKQVKGKKWSYLTLV